MIFQQIPSISKTQSGIPHQILTEWKETNTIESSKFHQLRINMYIDLMKETKINNNKTLILLKSIEAKSERERDKERFNAKTLTRW